MISQTIYFMKQLLLLVILSFLLQSCTKKGDNQGDIRIKNSILVEDELYDFPNLNYFPHNDSVNQAWVNIERTSRNKKANNIDLLNVTLLENCNCTLDSNKLFIKLTNSGHWEYRELSLLVTDTIISRLIFGNDINYWAVEPQYVKLELRNIKPEIDEIIYGKVIAIFDTLLCQVRTKSDTGLANIKITENIFGYFKCKVKKPIKERPWFLNLYAF